MLSVGDLGVEFVLLVEKLLLHRFGVGVLTLLLGFELFLELVELVAVILERRFELDDLLRLGG